MSNETDSTSFQSYLERLSSRTGESWSEIFDALSRTDQQLSDLRSLIGKLKLPANTSVLGFGSLARGEWSVGSDLDWTLLVDGPADMRHFDDTKRVEAQLEGAGYPPPGPTGTFGTMSGSHELVHHIGGSEDTNHNITRRILILLESVSLSDDITHERVTKAILERYIHGDPPATSPSQFRTPLFLLNDVVRFWRTMTVDYATKRWQRSSKGWALRNVKLRMSRKLLFTKGMLLCFLCDQEFAGQPSEGDPALVSSQLLGICYEMSRRSPLELLAEVVWKYGDDDTARLLFGAYENFLKSMNDSETRSHLKGLEFGADNDPIFEKQREMTRQFRDGLIRLFFDSNVRLGQLTRKYGVF